MTKEYYQNNKEYVSEYNKDYYNKNKSQILEKKLLYKSTMNYKANNMRQNYKKSDKRHNRGECTLTTDWIVNNIFTSKCVFCGESDWHKLGCDRIDNSKPHTPDNVQCCCYDCNSKKHTYTVEEFMNKIKPTSI